MTRLTRFSIFHDLLGADLRISARREQFSRIELLKCREIIDHVNGKPFVGEKLSFDRRCFHNSLRRIVEGGIESVVCRRRNDKGYFPEPSVAIPYVHFRDRMIVLDRDEIDGFLSIRFLFESYLATAGPGTKPLSIAVFGPPGAGKSFAVTEILRSVGKTPELDSMKLNLSQFSRLEELSKAFHRIQDRALAGQLPIAFFDEFDAAKNSDELGWLKFFLAPMQDGEFFDGDDTFHVGPAIFVFAGGTARTFDEFRTKYHNHTLKKAPDFISRLRGHLDIKDITEHNSSEVDEKLKVRRAVLLRSLLKNKARSIFDESGDIARIDEAIVAALLNVCKFEHGARSLEAIIEMAGVGDSGTFQKSSLPTMAQLNMHVSGEEFVRLINRDWLTEE